MTKATKAIMAMFKLPLLLILIIFVFNNALEVVQYGFSGTNWQSEINKFLFGLACFLIGIDTMSKGMKRWAGDSLRSILARLTQNRILGVFIGGIVTVVIQSSSATVGMLVSFVKSGLMNFPQTLGPILGADIGTTITAWMVTFKLTEVAIPIFLAGFLLKVFYRENDKLANFFIALTGFGILFLGIKFMDEVVAPMKNSDFFAVYTDYLKNPFWGVLVGTVFTAVINSSSATIAMVVTLTGTGLITLESGIPLILGANIGTCITAFYISQGGVPDGKRVALAHTLFKVFGVCLFVWWIPTFAETVRWIIAPLEDLPKTQMAMAHTLFNVVMVLVFIPFISKFANLIYWIIPKKEQDFNLITWNLDKNLLNTPAFAIAEARKRIANLIEDVCQMLDAIIIPFVSDPRFIQRQGEKEGWPQEEIDLFIEVVPKYDEQNPEWTLIEGIQKREEAIDAKKREFENYCHELLSGELSKQKIKEIDSISVIANHLENIADIVHDKLLPLLEEKSDIDYDLTDEGKQELMIYHNKVCDLLKQSAEIFSNLDSRVHKNIHYQIGRNRKLYENLRSSHLDRFQKRVESKATDEVHAKFLENMKIINGYIGEIIKDCEILLTTKS